MVTGRGRVSITEEPQEVGGAGAGPKGTSLMFRWLRKGLVAVALALVLLAAGHGDFRPSDLELAVAPHRFSLVRWELSHFLDKWVDKLGDILPWNSAPDRAGRIAQVQGFFALGTRLRELERRLLFPLDTTGSPLSSGEERSLREQVEGLKTERSRMRAEVEETIEAEVSAILVQEGFASRIGLIFPPVDTVLSGSPAVLILSPRDRIHRLRTILLNPGLDDEERGRIEDRIFREENLAALVESTSGVATYPSVIADSTGLRHALENTAHEWVHQWLFFQPLGQHYWDSSQMTTLNETAATLAGRVIGDRAFSSMTGAPVPRELDLPPPPEAGGFDFDTAMRETRLRTEELLTQGKIKEAEAYMEERRQFMAANGRFIRKINQAFFAFHGSYATSPASISPVDKQLKALQSRTDSLEEFVKTVARFGSYQEFLDHLATAGSKPAPVVSAAPQRANLSRRDLQNDYGPELLSRTLDRLEHLLQQLLGTGVHLWSSLTCCVINYYALCFVGQWSISRRMR